MECMYMYFLEYRLRNKRLISNQHIDFIKIMLSDKDVFLQE